MENSFAVPALIIVLLGTPLTLGIVALVACFRSRKRWLRWACGFAGVSFVAVFAYFLIGGMPYLWACHLENSWRAADPETKAGMESHLSLYREHEIQPSESGWGQNYELAAGERMVQYMILWNAPLDVVYDSADKVVRIFTSYE